MAHHPSFFTAHVPRQLAPADLSVSIDQPLDSVAGFYTSETEALAAQLRLSTVLGLTPEQLLLLRPQDGGSLRFAWWSRQWASRPRSEGSGLGNVELLAMLSVTLAGLGGAMLLAVGNALLIFVLAVLSAAAIGAAWAGRVHQPRHLTKFAGVVRRQLVAGRWGLLAHGVLEDRQANLVSLIRARSVSWCAVSVARYAL
jgi:hypothetical protein